MMPGFSLSEGFFRAVLVDGAMPENPVLQVIAIKPVEAQTPESRCRMTLSDGENSYNSCVTAAQTADACAHLDVNSLVRLTNYQVTVMPSCPSRKLVVINDLDMIGSSAVRIGDPVIFSDPTDLPRGGAASRAPPPAAAAAAVAAPPRRPPPAAAVYEADQKPPPFQARGGGNAYEANYGGSAVVRYPAAPRGPTIDAPRATMAAAGANCHPISSLNPYQNKWRIRVRVTNKAELRTYKNARGDGKLFSMDLADQSGEIRATAFNEQCDRFYNLIVQDGCYYISGGTIKPANKQFTSLRNDYELTFSQNTEVSPCHDVGGMTLPKATYNFTKLNQLPQQVSKTIDAIGVLKSCTDVTSIMTKRGEQLEKRELTIVDDSGVAVTLTLWGAQARGFRCPDSDPNPVVAIRGALVKDFQGGVSLSCGNSAQMALNPDVQQCFDLRGWFDDEGRLLEFQAISRGGGSGGGGGQFKPIGVAEAQRLGNSDQSTDYFSVRAHLAYCKSEQSIYKACPSTECNKKLVELESGNYRCEKCSKEGKTFKYRAMLSMEVVDFTGAYWVTLFSEQVEQLTGRTPAQLGELREQSDEAFEQVFQDVICKPINLRIRAKTEHFNDEARVKWTAHSVRPLDWNQYSNFLKEQIGKLESPSL